MYVCMYIYVCVFIYMCTSIYKFTYIFMYNNNRTLFIPLTRKEVQDTKSHT